MSLTRVPDYEPGAVPDRGETAIVVGSGVAGLLAARVLADAFDRVEILERDTVPADPVARNGVPQSNHVHAMLEAGRATFEELFPGYGAAVRSRGGVEIDAATDFDYFHQGAFLADGPDRLPMVCASRPLFEDELRARVLERERVTLRTEASVTAYLPAESDAGVRGVRVATGAAGEQRLDADLVVDASGRSSRTPTWLDDHGYGAPPLEDVEIDLLYSSVTVDRPADDHRAYLVAPWPPVARGGTAIPVEDGAWKVTLFGLHGDHPPADREGFLAFADTLPTPVLSDLLDAQRIRSTEIHQYPFPSNRWHHYEALPRFPDGLLPIGDAIASFNPIYGQGMSVAALEAFELHRALRTAGRDLATPYFDGVETVINDIWRTTVGADFAFPETEGPRPRGTALSNRYLSRVIRAAHGDGRVSDALARVLRLERPPRSLLKPQIIARVLLAV